MQLSTQVHLRTAKALIHSASHHAEGTIMREFNLDLAAYHAVQWWISLEQGERELRKLWD